MEGEGDSEEWEDGQRVLVNGVSKGGGEGLYGSYGKSVGVGWSNS